MMRRSRFTPALWLLLLASLLPAAARAQSYIDQAKVEKVLDAYQDGLEDLPEVGYRYYVLGEGDSLSGLRAKLLFYKTIGEGDPYLGQERAILVEILNRKLLDELEVGDTLIVPDRFELDFRAYAPFPRTYEGGEGFDKLFLIDKNIQAFAAYEHGALARWGIVNSGGPESPTPAGRFNFNWKEESRVSLLSPDDEPWDMYWVFNFHNKRGMHVHQYHFPTGGPSSHGCVRLVEADARWIYEWADAWKTTRKGTGYSSREGKVLQQGTTVLILGVEPKGDPDPFDRSGPVPVLKPVSLPKDPYAVRAGTEQQEHFDRLRRSQKRAKATR